MGKIAIIIEGEENSGKTSTIKEIVKIICKKEEETENKNIIMRKDEEHFHDTSNKELSINELSNHINKKEEDHKSKDIGLIIQLNNGIKIGIESEGDPDSKKKEKLLSSLEKFKKEKCDIILCAIRHYKGKRCDELYEEVEDILGNIDMKVRLSKTEAKMILDLEYFKTILGNKNNKEKFINKDIYKRVWITNIYAKNKDIQAECNEESAELIYGLIEKAISLILEKTSE